MSRLKKPAKDSARILQEINDQILDCPVCMNQFTSIGAERESGEVDRTPKMLECHHCFCLSCLQAVLNTQVTILCPICKHCTNMKGKSLQSLYSNYVIDNLLRITSLAQPNLESAANTEQPAVDSTNDKSGGKVIKAATPSSASGLITLHLHCPGYQWRLRAAATDSATCATIGTFDNGQIITVDTSDTILGKGGLEFFKYSIMSTDGSTTAYVMKWTKSHKVPWEIRKQTKRLKVLCPGFEIRVRKEADPSGEILTFIQNEEEIEVFKDLSGQYYKLSNGIGYILSNIEGVKYVTVAEFP